MSAFSCDENGIGLLTVLDFRLSIMFLHDVCDFVTFTVPVTVKIVLADAK